MALKSKTRKHDWSEALDKRDEEGHCRACEVPDGYYYGGDEELGPPVRLQCAHTIGRDKQDEVVTGPRGGIVVVVKRESTVPLCEDCHRAYDARRLDLLPYLTLKEELDAVRAAGGIERARSRLIGGGPEPSFVGGGV